MYGRHISFFCLCRGCLCWVIVFVMVVFVVAVVVMLISRPGEARGCSTNTSVINKLIHSVMVCENIFTAPPRPNG